jgi:hypothetical protein
MLARGPHCQWHHRVLSLFWSDAASAAAARCCCRLCCCHLLLVLVLQQLKLPRDWDTQRSLQL